MFTIRGEGQLDQVASTLTRLCYPIDTENLQLLYKGIQGRWIVDCNSLLGTFLYNLMQLNAIFHSN